MAVLSKNKNMDSEAANLKKIAIRNLLQKLIPN